MRKSPLFLVILSGISAALLWAYFGFHFLHAMQERKSQLPSVPHQMPDGSFAALYVVACIGGAIAIIAGILHVSAKDRFTATCVGALNFLAIWGFMELHRIGALVEHAEYAKLHGVG